MQHVVTFLLLAALITTAIGSTVSAMLYRMNQKISGLWFALLTSGLGCFVIEIIVYRYSRIQPSGAVNEQTGLYIFSELWALLGAMFIAIAMPQLTRQMTGFKNSLFWKFIQVSLPCLTLLSGILLLLNFYPSVMIIMLQSMIFGSVVIGFLLIGFISKGSNSGKERYFLARVSIWTALLLPAIILDATGFFPSYLNDLPISVFVPGISLIILTDIPEIFGSPAFLEAGKLSQYFVIQHSITIRETEIITLLIEGQSNPQIADKLCISLKTVENHLTSIFKKTGVKNRIQLFRLINSSSI